MPPLCVALLLGFTAPAFADIALVLEFETGPGVPREVGIYATESFASHLFHTGEFGRVAHSIKQYDTQTYLPCFASDCAQKARQELAASTIDKIYVGRVELQESNTCHVSVKRLTAAGDMEDMQEENVQSDSGGCGVNDVEGALQKLASSVSCGTTPMPAEETPATEAAPARAESPAEEFIKKARAALTARETEKYLGMAITADANYAETYILRGFLYCDLKRYKKAILDFKAVELLASGDERIYYGRAEAYMRLEKFKTAEKLLTHALTLSHDSAKALLDMARVKWKLRKDASSAVDFVRRSVKAGMDMKTVQKALSDTTDPLYGLNDTPEFQSLWGK
jgi:tetratricopeptide (TPR) repeat protein